MNRLRAIFKKKDLPPWFIRLNYLSLTPVIAWPVVAFGSVFMFDNPVHTLLTFLLFFLINGYPLFLLGNMLLSFRLYRSHRIPAILLAGLPISLFICFLIYFFCI